MNERLQELLDQLHKKISVPLPAHLELVSGIVAHVHQTLAAIAEHIESGGVDVDALIDRMKASIRVEMEESLTAFDERVQKILTEAKDNMAKAVAEASGKTEGRLAALELAAKTPQEAKDKAKQEAPAQQS